MEAIMLSQEQIESYQDNGYLKVEGLVSSAETTELAADMVRIIEEWGEETIGWKGPWREHYLNEEERENTKAVFLHNPHFYSAAWGRIQPRICRRENTIRILSIRFQSQPPAATPPAAAQSRRSLLPPYTFQ